MTYSDEETLDCLKYRLLSPTPDPTAWGHEYVRHLTSEIGIRYNQLGTQYMSEEIVQQTKEYKELLDLAQQLIPFLLQHNAEVDAVDLLFELDSIKLLESYVDDNTWERCVAYLVACVPLLVQDEDRSFLEVAHNIYRTFGRLIEAMTVSIRLDDPALIEEDWMAAPDE
jgi:26S proteasome regulatory subunit N1